MAQQKLRIIHCFRSPVGGIFRHVRDLVEAHHNNGHEVGILCDSLTGGAHEERLFAEIEPKLGLGLTRIPMRRAITPGDLIALRKTYKHIKELRPDVLHSHGAKGGAYARIIGSLLRVSGTSVARLYCPHGGSIHYNAGSLKGRLFFALERAMERMSDRLIFVSDYEKSGYEAKVGPPRCPTSLIYNGLSPHEFVEVGEDPDATDFLYIGMMRDLKGPDVFLDALEKLYSAGEKVTAHFVGDGPDKESYIKRINTSDLKKFVTVHEAMPARDAFRKAKCVVVPSRAESMPYIVLEAIAAGKPIICTNVGGIPEIFDQEPEQLIAPGDSTILAAAMRQMMANKNRKSEAASRKSRLQERFSVAKMADDVMTAYRLSIKA
ncbi:MAG: glycosyltransferase family 4 protein [Salaquimonas sp.]